LSATRLNPGVRGELGQPDRPHAAASSPDATSGLGPVLGISTIVDRLAEASSLSIRPAARESVAPGPGPAHQVAHTRLELSSLQPMIAAWPVGCQGRTPTAVACAP